MSEAPVCCPRWHSKAPLAPSISVVYLPYWRHPAEISNRSTDFCKMEALLSHSRQDGHNSETYLSTSLFSLLFKVDGKVAGVCKRRTRVKQSRWPMVWSCKSSDIGGSFASVRWKVSAQHAPGSGKRTPECEIVSKDKCFLRAP